MPRTLVRAPGHDRRRSLGWLALAWIEHMVRHGPGDVQGMPVEHGDEYTGFIVDCYAQSQRPTNNHLVYDAGFLSRAKGCDKSGLGARLALFEGLGPCRFAGWARGGEVFEDPWGLGFTYEYELGEPMGRAIQVPFVRLLATEEGQTSNTYDSVYFNLTDDDCPLSQVPGVDCGKGQVFLPWGGRIMPSTASGASKDGGKETFAVFDESHLYNLPELKRMYRTVTRNLRKRKKLAGTWYLETTTMFAAGEESVAEATYGEAEAILEGRKRGEITLLYDHRWGEVEDLSNEEELRAGLIEAYGDATWIDIDGLVNEFWDSRNDPYDSRRYFLNAQTNSSDAWLAAQEWDGCGRPDRQLQDRDFVTLGLDGSTNDDSTCLVACRVSDGHLELLDAWERPPGRLGEHWQVDRIAVDAAVAQAMKRFEVAGFYMDPAHWQDYSDKWASEFGEKMQVKATQSRPLEWWTNKPTRMVAALERFHEAVVDRRLSFTPAADRTGRTAELAVTLRRHALNARRRPGRSGLTIAKEYPKSPKKIDAIMSAVLAFEARGDAVAIGAKPRAARVYAAKRIR